MGWGWLGDLLGKGIGNAVAPVTVTAAGSALGANLGSSLGANAGSALGAAIANSGSGGGGGGGGGGDYTTVAPIEVTAPNGGGGGGMGDIDWGGALSSALASYAGGDVASAAPLDFSEFSGGSSATPGLANLGGGSAVAPLEVTAALNGRQDGLPMGASAGLVPGLNSLVPSPGEGELQPGLDELSAEDEPIDPNESEEERRARLLKKYGPLGLLGLLGGKGLLAAGLLGGGMLLNGGGTKGADTAAGGALTDQARTGLTTANALQKAGLAGMNGDIGGKGLNSIARMVRNAQAAIRQRYAGMGMSGSTAEQQDLNSAALSGVDMQFKIGQEMAQTGLSAAASLAGQSATIYAALMNAQTQKDSQLGNALANFAGAVAK